MVGLASGVSNAAGWSWDTGGACEMSASILQADPSLSISPRGDTIYMSFSTKLSNPIDTSNFKPHASLGVKRLEQLFDEYIEQNDIPNVGPYHKEGFRQKNGKPIAGGRGQTGDI